MIGELKYRITFQEAIKTPDGGGGFTEVWQAMAVQPEVYAAIAPLSGGEQLRYHKLETTATHRFLIRHRKDITPNLRIVREGLVYDISSVTERDGLGVFLEILAVERTP